MHGTKWIKNKWLYLLIMAVFQLLCSCSNEQTQKKAAHNDKESVETKKEQEPSPPVLKEVVIPIADAFDFPVGKPNGKGYYNAQKFTENYHLGDDWNATTGGNSDLGDPIYAVANGLVKFAANIDGGWGNIIRINHELPNGRKIESLYAHCDQIKVKVGQVVSKGEEIGTIGNVNGLYLAHLHFEIRNRVDMEVGGGYSSDTVGYEDPTLFIEAHRTID